MANLRPHRSSTNVTTSKCPHVRGKVKWGIAASEKWCSACKRFVPLEIDWSGHP